MVTSLNIMQRFIIVSGILYLFQAISKLVHIICADHSSNGHRIIADKARRHLTNAKLIEMAIKKGMAFALSSVEFVSFTK